MHFNSFTELLSNLRDFIKQHPDAFIETVDIPRQLRLGFTALADDGTQEGIKMEWTVGLAALKKATENNEVSDKTYLNLIYAQKALRNAEVNWINEVAGKQIR